MEETTRTGEPEVSDPEVSDPGDETQDDQERYDGGDIPRTTETETEVDED